VICIVPVFEYLSLSPGRSHCMNARWNRCWEDLNRARLWITGGDHQDALILHGWRVSSKTWNTITSAWMKQLTWLRIVHSGDWCLLWQYALLVVPGRKEEEKCLSVIRVHWWLVVMGQMNLTGTDVYKREC